MERGSIPRANSFNSQSSAHSLPPRGSSRSSLRSTPEPPRSVLRQSLLSGPGHVSPVQVDEVEDAVSVSERMKCPNCHKTFGRVEHLKRHMYSHAEKKSVACLSCGKCFSRTDSLRRHELIHKSPAVGEIGKQSGGLSSGSSRAVRACINCAGARARCTGEIPCHRCDERSLECQYPEKRTKLNPEPASSELNNIQSMVDHQNQNLGDHPSMAASGSTQSNPSINLPGITQKTRGRPAGDVRSSVADFGQGTRWNGTATESQFADSSAIELEPTRDDADGDISHISQTDFNADFLDLGMMSALNWLPTSFTSDFYDDLGDSSSLLFPSTFMPLSTTAGPDAPPQSLDDMRTAENAANSSPQDQFSQRSPQGFSYVFGSQPVISPDTASPSLHSETNSTQDNLPTGSFYVDGGGARLSRAKVRRESSMRASGGYLRPPPQASPDEPQVMDFPDIDSTMSTLVDVDVCDNWISGDQYHEISSCFHKTRRTSGRETLNSESANFPSMRSFNYLIQLSIDNFLTVVPIIHRNTLRFPKPHWILYLALAAMGTHYLDVENSGTLVISMQELLNRAILLETEGSNMEEVRVAFVQAKLFSCIGSFYSGEHHEDVRKNPLYIETIKFYHQHLSNPLQFTDGPGEFSSEAFECRWAAWLAEETLYRTAYYIWLLDCMLAYHQPMRPMLSLDDAKLPLPCVETLWEAESAGAWHENSPSMTRNPSLREAIHELYLDKKVRSSIGELGRILLIHALYQQTWDVGSYYRRPLSSWIPTAQKRANFSLPRDSVWLPGNEMYSKWRNCACDCIDILHWAANSVIGAASGIEHPTVCHLHLSRVVLLTPHEEIRKIALSKADESITFNPEALRDAHQQVHRWFADDQYKARLAMIHAGVLFWHVRRHSANAFYEPDAVFLATLALWAYGSIGDSVAGRNTNKTPSASAEAESDDGPSPIFIHLDRPCDDELVQLFIKSGNTMIANIAGVGNIRGSKSPERILREGCRLLARSMSWGAAAKYARILTKLAAAIESNESVRIETGKDIIYRG